MSEPKIPEDLAYDYEFAKRCGNDHLCPGYLIVQLIERIARLEQERDALKAQVARLSKALQKQNAYMKCDEGSEEYPSEGCNCEACGIQRLVDDALAARAKGDHAKEEPHGTDK